MSKGFMLIILNEDNTQDHLLTKAVYTIGRGKNCDFRLQGLLSSRLHATLVRIDNDEYDEYPGNDTYYQIHDGDLEENISFYGLYVNGEKVDTKDLKTGDMIVFGVHENQVGVQANYLVYSVGEIEEEKEGGTGIW